MGFLSTLGLIVAGILGFVAVFLLLYGATLLLPHGIRQRAQGIPFTLIAIVFAVGGLLVSAIRTFYFSLHDDVGQKFIGIANYKEIFTDTSVRIAVLNSLMWVVFGTLITVTIGLAIARFSDGMRGERFAKTLIFLPVAISLVGAGITWKFIYAERGNTFKAGLLNEVTKFLHLPASMGGSDEGRNWLLERGIGPLNPPSWAPGFNTFLLIIIFIWAQAGIATVVLSAAIKGVPQELQEAARVDGATSNEVFFKVTLPYIKGTMATVISLIALASLKAFDTVAGATGGRFDTSTIANEYYVKYFVSYREGFASSLAVLLFLMCFPVVVWNRRVQRKVDETN